MAQFELQRIGNSTMERKIFMSVLSKFKVTDFDMTEQEQLKDLLRMVFREIKKGYENV